MLHTNLTFICRIFCNTALIMLVVCCSLGTAALEELCLALHCCTCMQWIPFDRAVSLSDRSGICRRTLEAWSGLSGQVAWCTEGSCAVITDRLAQSRPRPTAIAHEQKDDFLFTSWPVILSVFVSFVVVREVRQQHIHTHTSKNANLLTLCCFIFPCIRVLLLTMWTFLL